MAAHVTWTHGHMGDSVSLLTRLLSTVLRFTVQYSTVQYSTVQYGTVLYWYCMYIQYCTVLYSTVLYCTVCTYQCQWAIPLSIVLQYSLHGHAPCSTVSRAEQVHNDRGIPPRSDGPPLFFFSSLQTVWVERIVGESGFSINLYPVGTLKEFSGRISTVFLYIFF